MNRLTEVVKQKDTTLWLKMKEQDLKPQYYAFRWITLLLSQEFPLPGTCTRHCCENIIYANNLMKHQDE